MRIFLRWLRFVIEEVLSDRTHVILNADETSLTAVEHSGMGMASGYKRKHSGGRTRPRDCRDRFHTKVTYMAVIADSPELQPLLPQVILPKYTQNSAIPNYILDKYALFGFPFEFWHGSKGAVTPGIMQAWITRLRSAVSSFNSDAWIVLLMDCSTSHLSLLTMAHIRRFGIIVVPVPAKLTWLLQVLDVYVFGVVKKDIRIEESRSRLASDHGGLSRLERMRIATNSIRRHLVNSDWSSAFEKLGAGQENRPTSARVTKYVPPGEITPALPTLQEFADMIARNPHTDTTQRLYRMVISATLDVKKRTLTDGPRAGARIELPFAAPSHRRMSNVQMQTMSSHAVIDEFLADERVGPPVLNEPRLARNHYITNAGRPAD